MRTLMLLGSGEFTPSLLETDRLIIEKQRRILGRDPRVVIIPTAAGKEKHPDVWIRDAKRHFAKLDLIPDGLMILNREDAENNSLALEIDNYDIFYFSGGHPGYLFDTLVDTLVWKKILRKYEEGKVIAGSSAGAMVMGKFLLKNAEEAFDSGADPIWGEGFGLIKFTLIPHFKEIGISGENTNRFKQIIEAAPIDAQNSILGIEENTAFILNDESEGIISGEGQVVLIENGVENSFKESLTL